MILKYKIFSPSYKRAKTVRSHKCIPDLIYVVHEFEKQAYEAEGLNVWAIPDDVKGSIARVRNYILDHCGEDRLIMVDDDMSRISRYREGKSSALNYDEVGEFIEQGFNLAGDLGVHLWGMNVLPDKQAYREHTPISLTNLILGPFSAHLDNPCRYDERLPLKEDYDMSIQVLNKFRKVLRFNAYHYYVDHYTIPGGCADYRTVDREKGQFDLLQKKWGPEIVQRDHGDSHVQRKKKKAYDINPIIRVPIKGV